jgi:hypothetical protein
MRFETLACRLAGDFSTAIDDDTLRDVIQRVLPETEIGELEAIRRLPGMVDAVAGTLHPGVAVGDRPSSESRRTSPIVVPGRA